MAALVFIRTHPVFCGHQTDDYPVDCSVPQGPVLGPLAFIAYTEDSMTSSSSMNRLLMTRNCTQVPPLLTSRVFASVCHNALPMS